MITITGLTKKQVRLLDEMWERDSFEEFNEWYETHSESDRNMIDSLQQMVVAESIEESLGECKEAQELLSKF